MVRIVMHKTSAERVYRGVHLMICKGARSPPAYRRRFALLPARPSAWLAALLPHSRSSARRSQASDELHQHLGAQLPASGLRARLLVHGGARWVLRCRLRVGWRPAACAQPQVQVQLHLGALLAGVAHCRAGAKKGRDGSHVQSE